jgi:flagellar hook-associated protein 3 FlgL
MRVTMNMMYANTTWYVQQSQAAFLKAQEVLSTTKKINRPSDDPVGSARALDLRKTLSLLDQFDRNLGTASGFTQETETALSNVVSGLQSAQELAVGVSSGTPNQGTFQAAAEQMDGIISEALRNMNSKYEDQYIFSGYQTQTQPFDDQGQYHGGAAGQDIEVEISQGQYLTINYTGDEVFKGPVDVPQVLIDLRNAMAAGDQAGIVQLLPQVSAALDQVVAFQSSMGPISNQITTAKNDNATFRIGATAILSDVEDADMAAATTEFTKQQQALETTLTVAGKVLAENFLDFLR